MKINRSGDASTPLPKQPAAAQPATAPAPKAAQPQAPAQPQTPGPAKPAPAAMPTVNPNTRQGAWQLQHTAGRQAGVRASVQPPAQRPARPAVPQPPKATPQAPQASAAAPQRAPQVPAARAQSAPAQPRPAAPQPPKATPQTPQAPAAPQPPQQAKASTEAVPAKRQPHVAISRAKALAGDVAATAAQQGQAAPPQQQAAAAPALAVEGRPARPPEVADAPAEALPQQEAAPAADAAALFDPEAEIQPARKRGHGGKPKKEKKMKNKAPQPQEDDEDDDRRPRWHAPVGCLVLLLFLGLVAFGVWQVSRLYSEVSGGHELGAEVAFRVEQGASVAQIAKDLQAAGFVEHDWLFRYYTQYSGKEGGVQFGEHILQKGMSYNDILDSLSQQVEHRETVTLTFPEGTTAAGIGQILQDNGMCTVEEFLACANGTDGSDFSKYGFWTQIPENPGRLLKCEGYLFPDTYEFYADATVYEIVDTFYKEFDRQISELSDQIASSGMSIDEIVILASFIQEEAGFTEGEEALLNNQRVAACFYNRLHSTDPLWSEHRLESNASSYITNDSDNNYLWNSPMATYMGWRDAGAIPDEVLAAYDTYRISGLPAGAISNPGRVSLQAAMSPDQQYIDEGYYFFVTGHPDTDVAGQYFFAKTADEHVVNVKKAGWA